MTNSYSFSLCSKRERKLRARAFYDLGIHHTKVLISIMESSDNQSHSNNEATNSALCQTDQASKIMMNDSETSAFSCTPFDYRGQSLRSLHLSQCSLDTSVVGGDDDDMEYSHNHAASMTRVQYDWLDLLYMEPEDSHHSRAHHILEQKQEFDDNKEDSASYDKGVNDSVEAADDTMSCAGDGANVLPQKRKQDRHVSFMEESPSKRIHMMVATTGSNR